MNEEKPVEKKRPPSRLRHYPAPPDSPYHPGILLEVPPELLEAAIRYALQNSGGGRLLRRADGFRELTRTGMEACRKRGGQRRPFPYREGAEHRVPRVQVRLHAGDWEWVVTYAAKHEESIAQMIRDLMWTGATLTWPDLLKILPEG